MSTRPTVEPSNYMQELTRYLSNIMNSVLLGLPTEIKEFIYFDALSHASTMILVRSLPLIVRSMRKTSSTLLITFLPEPPPRRSR